LWRGRGTRTLRSECTTFLKSHTLLLTSIMPPFRHRHAPTAPIDLNSFLRSQRDSSIAGQSTVDPSILTEATSVADIPRIVWPKWRSTYSLFLPCLPNVNVSFRKRSYLSQINATDFLMILLKRLSVEALVRGKGLLIVICIVVVVVLGLESRRRRDNQWPDWAGDSAGFPD
jgi:hypothetical protein